MSMEQEYPLHVAIWKEDVDKLAQLIKEQKVSCFEWMVRERSSIFNLIRIELNNVILVIVLRFN